MANMFQMTAPIQPGSSGGPVINKRGEVVGVTTSTAAIGAFVQRAGSLPQNVNFGIKSEYVGLLVPAAGERPQPNRTREQAIDAGLSAVCRIIAK